MDSEKSGHGLPKSVLVADDRIYLKILSDPSSVDLLEDLEAMVLPYSQRAMVNPREVASVRELLVASGQFTRNALLVKNPYDSSGYEPAESAIEAFASAKYHVLANVARLLGAKEMRVLEAKVGQSTARWNANLAVKIPIAGAKARATREVTKRLVEQLEARMTFPGSDPDVEEATAFLLRRNLSNDQQLRDLVELRTGSNPISVYTVKLSGTRESTTNLNCALDIANAGPIKAAKIGASFSRTFESISNIEISTEITF